MATVYKLSWRAAEQRWRKRYKGREYYFPANEGEGKVRSYSRCQDEWLKKKAEIDNDQLNVDPNRRAWETFIAKLRHRQELLAAKDTEDNRREWSFLDAMIGSYRQMIQDGASFYAEGEEIVDPETIPPPIIDVDDPSPPPWERDQPEAESEAPTSLEGNVKRFLKRKQEQAQRGERSHGRYDSLRCCLEDFTKAIGGTKPLASIGGYALSRYRDNLEARVAKGTFSPSYARTILQAVKQFVRWAWEEELMDLPRVIESRGFTISIPDRKIEVFATSEIAVILGACPESTKLYILLMLNCGVQQQDIAELRQDEVDWKRGRITRKRSKTGNHENVPEVCYKLWPETFRLLKLFRSKHPTLALTNRKGTPLKTEEIINGKVKKIDNIRSAYNRIVRSLAERDEDPIKIDKPLKLLRKTAASKLGEHEAYGRYAQYFLGHAPSNVADRHYVKPSEDQFNKAVDWLGKQFCNR